MSAAPDAGICVTSGSMAGLEWRGVYRRRRWRYRSKHGCVHGWTDRCVSPSVRTSPLGGAGPTPQSHGETRTGPHLQLVVLYVEETFTQHHKTCYDVFVNELLPAA